MSLINEQNPLGIDAIDHLEFTCEDLQTTQMREIFYTLGFAKTYESTNKEQQLYSQGQVRFLLTANSDNQSLSNQYYKKHGEGVSKISFLVEDASHALNEAHRRGAKIVEALQTTESEHGVYRYGSIQGFGDVLNEFIERPKSFFRPNFTKLDHDQNAKHLIYRHIGYMNDNLPSKYMFAP